MPLLLIRAQVQRIFPYFSVPLTLAYYDRLPRYASFDCRVHFSCSCATRELTFAWKENPELHFEKLGWNKVLTNVEDKTVIIATGGTISCVKNHKTGSLKVKHKVLLKFIKQSSFDREHLAVHLLKKPFDSAEAHPECWTDLTELVVKYLKARVRGIVITHGTDSLAYSAAAVAFGVPWTNVPIVLTASQLPLDDQGSDGVSNLIGAYQLASRTSPSGVEPLLLPGVWVYMNQKVMRAGRIVKMNASSLDAFDTPQSSYPARMVLNKFDFDVDFVRTTLWNTALQGFENGMLTVTKNKPAKNKVKDLRHAGHKFLLALGARESDNCVEVTWLSNLLTLEEGKEHDFDTHKVTFHSDKIPRALSFGEVAMVHIYPTNPKNWKTMLNIATMGQVKGLLIVGYGTGNGPAAVRQWIAGLPEQQSDLCVAICSGCPVGFTSNHYDTGLHIKGQTGLATNMTPAAALVKLAICVDSEKEWPKDFDRPMKGDGPVFYHQKPKTTGARQAKRPAKDDANAIHAKNGGRAKKRKSLGTPVADPSTSPSSKNTI